MSLSLKRGFLMCCLLTFASFGKSQCDLYISGIIDGGLSGGLPKGVLLCANNNIADLSQYGIGSANNGGGSDGEEFTFPSVSLSAGQCIWVASESTAFTTYFGFAPDYTTGAVNVNGDDAIELFQNGAVVDLYGDINVDGTGQSWEYLDSYATRTTSDCATTFDINDWNVAAPNTLDGISAYCNILPQDPFGLGTCSQSPCGITNIGAVTVSCNAETSGLDAVTVNIPYTGVDANAIITNNGSGTVGGDDPTSITDGTITLTGLNEGDSYDIDISGGLCSFQITGTVSTSLCLIASTQTCTPDTDCSQWSIEPSVQNSQLDNWTCNAGTYSVNGFVGSGAGQQSLLYLVSSPIDLSAASSASISSTVNVPSFTGTGNDLIVQYTTAYVGGQDPALESWTSIDTIAASATGVFPTNSVVPAAAIGNSSVVFCFRYETPNGEPGTTAGIELSDISVDVSCPSSCGITGIGPASFTCLANTAGVDGVTIDIPYTGVDAAVSVSYLGSGTISGDNPAAVSDGTIQLTGLSEGDSFNVEITGGNCSGLVVSGTIPANECPDPSALCDLYISAIYDGDITGGLPKGIRLCANNNIADLSVYGLGSANNGGGTDGQEFTFPAVALSAGSCIWVASETTEFTNYFGFAPDYTNGVANNNGDDAVELFLNGAVVDLYGDINVDGTGQAWEYTDSYAYRNTADCTTTFDVNDWTIPGPNTVDGFQTYCSITPQDPIGLGTCSTPSCGVTSIGSAVITCLANTAGVDGVTIEISYTGVDAAVSVTNNAGGTVGGDDPATVSNGTITITGLNEGDAYDIEISGGSCIGLTASGTVAVDQCPELSASCDLYISAVIDGPLSGGLPKAVLLCSNNPIADLSVYGVSSANNGGGTTGSPEFTFPAVSLAANTCIWLASESTQFTSYFGFAPDYTDGAANINGDDAIELFLNGTVVDVFGDVNVDGTGQTWEYLDSYAYRNNSDCSTTFSDSDWTFGGTNVLDGQSDYCQIVPQDPFNLGTCTTPSCGISALGNPSLTCLAYTTGTDGLTVTIPYTGIDAGAIITNNGSGTIGGDDPTAVADGNIVISGLNEGDLYAFDITGGLCSLSINGSIPADACAVVTATTQTCTEDTDCSQWSPVASVLNSQGDNWTCDMGTYTANAFAGFNANEPSSIYLISSPLDLTTAMNAAITATIDVDFTGDDLQVLYSTTYVGGQDPANETWVSMGSFSGATTGTAFPANFPIPAGALGNASVVFAFLNTTPTGAQGVTSSYDLYNLSVDIDCGGTPVCGITSVGPETITCTGFTAGNDGVIVTIPYLGLDPLASVTNNGSGTVGGDDPSMVNSGNIVITGLSEGDSYDIEITGGVCTGLSISGTVTTAQCPDPQVPSPNLVISEIMYNETGNDDEWIEICNLEASAVNLTAFVIKVNSTAEFVFPVGATVAAGECITVSLASDNDFPSEANFFNDLCPFTPDYGILTTNDKLPNSGSNLIELCNQVITVIDDVTYTTTSASNGNGSSLEVIDPSTDNSNTTNGNWQDGLNGGDQLPSPGVSNDQDVDCSLPASPEAGNVVVGEILYDPCFQAIGGDSEFEFIELWNTTGSAIDVSGWTILGVEFTFPAASSIAANSSVIVTVNADNYGGASAAVFQWVSGSLSNGGETLTLLDASLLLVDEVPYDDGNGWPGCADNNNCASLVLTDLNADNTDPANWAASAEFGGSPNAANAASETISGSFVSVQGLCNGDNVEFELTFDVVDGFGTYQIVLASDSSVLGSVSVADGMDITIQGVLPGPTPGGTFDVILWDVASPNCGPGSFTITDPGCGEICPIQNASVMYSATCNGNDADVDISFDVVGGSGNYTLFDADGTTVLGTNTSGIIDGNVVISTTIIGPTSGAATFFVNDDASTVACQVQIDDTLPTCPAATADVIINEIHYNPCSAQGDDADFEFIEIFNNGGASADLSGWFFTGVTFVFPNGVSIAPGEYIVIALNGTTYGTPYQYTGGLSNGGETLSLSDSGNNIIDTVTYDDVSPWPTDPDGNCASLSLIDPNSDNSLPESWTSGANNGTPGAANSAGVSGCTDPAACNFDPAATIDDGSCIIPEVDTCPWDLDDSGDVDITDFLGVLGQFGLACPADPIDPPCPPVNNCPTDFDGSEVTDIADFLEVLGQLGNTCP